MLNSAWVDSMMFGKLLPAILPSMCLFNAALASENVATVTESNISTRIKDYQENCRTFGDSLAKPDYVCPDSLHFSEGLAVCASTAPCPLYGYINAKHDFVIAQQFIEARPFQNGLAAVANFSDTIINRNGKSIVPKFWGYIDHTGKYQLKLRPHIIQTREFSEGLAAAAIRDPKTTWPVWGYIDRSGEFVIPPRYDRAEAFANGLARIAVPDASREGAPLWSYINKKGTKVLAPAFVAITDLHEGLAVVTVNNPNSANSYSARGYMNKLGQIQIKPQFINADIFSEGLASVSLLNQNKLKFGFIDQTGRFQIPPKFIYAGRFAEGLAGVTIQYDDQRTAGGYIDKNGKFKIGPDPTISQPRPFSEGLAAVRKDERWGYMDRNGHWVIQPTFNFEAYPFHNGVAMGIDKIAPKQPRFGMLLAEPHKRKTFVDRNGKQYPAPEPDIGGRK